MDRIRLHSVEITNYLGVGEEPVKVEVGGNHAVLCGPNGSGKTTILSSVDVLRLLFDQWYLTPVRTTSPEFVEVAEWTDARPAVTADLFHGRAIEAAFGLVFLAPESLREIYPIADVARLLPSQGVFQVGVFTSVQKDQKLSLDRISIEGIDLFRKGYATPLLALANQQPVDSVRYQLKPREMPHLRENAAMMFSLPRIMAQRILYLPSRRGSTLGPYLRFGSMASGVGLTSWIRVAANPDPRDAEQQRRAELLQQFQDEFSRFAGFRRVSLSVPEVAQPVQTGDEPEVNVTVEGQARPASRLGAGIAESLIILLLCRLSQELDPPIDVVLLEEPELHLHQRLQRDLVKLIDSYGVQLIVSTHSPTIIDVLMKRGARVFSTRYEDSAKRISVQPVTETREARLLLESIGASPADLLLADKVLWVEGATDIPVFKAWLSKVPLLQGQNISVVSIGGDEAASDHFDVSHLSNLHLKMWAVLDSEKKEHGGLPEPSKAKIKDKLDASGIHCHLTERRSTECYFTARALKVVYSECPSEIDPYGNKNLANQGVKQFTTYRNGEVAEAMNWQELEGTDLSKFIEEFLSS